MSEEQRRKQRVCLNRDNFEQIKRLYKIKTKNELLEITNLGISALKNLTRKIESYDGADEPTFDVLYKKLGRKRKNKNELHNEIRSIMGNDDSLTLKRV